MSMSIQEMATKLKIARFEEGVSVDVPEYLREHGNPEAAEQWETEQENYEEKFEEHLKQGYSKDPYWTNARWPGVAKDGTPYKKGTKILFWPIGKTVMVGEQAEKAWREFQSQIQDEGMYASASKQASVTNVSTRILPDILKQVLKDVRFAKRIVSVHVQSTYQMAFPGDDGNRGFTVLVNLDTGAVDKHLGSFGGGALGLKQQKPVDSDHSERPLTGNTVVVQGQQGGNPYAFIVCNAGAFPMVAPKMRMAALPGDVETETNAKFEEGIPADPTENMSDEAKQKWDEYHGQVEKLAGEGLYGFTKATQTDCDAAMRKIQRHAIKIAKAAATRDNRISTFLETHAKRATSLPARILVAAIQSVKTASHDGEKKYCDGLLLHQPLETKEDIEKKEQSKEASRKGLYGFPAKTASLGLNACTELRAFVGELASDLHERRVNHYPHITGYFSNHAKQAKSPYARLILSCYPEPVSKKASEDSPRTVEAWLAWDEEPVKTARQDRFTDMLGKSFDVGSRIEFWRDGGRVWVSTVIGVDGPDKFLAGGDNGRNPVTIHQAEAWKHVKVVRG